MGDTLALTCGLMLWGHGQRGDSHGPAVDGGGDRAVGDDRSHVRLRPLPTTRWRAC